MTPSYEFIYVHFPFCEVICHYCDFYTARSKEAHHGDFFKALETEFAKARSNFSAPLKAIYLGGGTPSESPLELLELFFSPLKEFLGPETEVTFEANPFSLEEHHLKKWRELGVNRLSLGVQSLDDKILKKLGRIHSAKAAMEAIKLASTYFKNINGDLIYGVPDQAIGDPARDARKMVEAGVKHISAYNLSIPSSHFLYPKLPSDDFSLGQIRNLADELATQGFEHYEISNFSLPGFASKNNGNYWSGGPYWALGPSAHGFDGNKIRWKNIADWKAYVSRLAAGTSPIESQEEISIEQRRIEVLFTTLRTQKGLDLGLYEKTFGTKAMRRDLKKMESFVDQGLATIANNTFVLTFEGRMLADEIVKKLL